MPYLKRRLLLRHSGALLICVAPVVRAQSAADPRFDAIATLAEAKMKEFGVPGVALGIMSNGVATTRGLGVTNIEDPLPVTPHTESAGRRDTVGHDEIGRAHV